MVNKSTIGKIQIWIGIILLIGSVIGLIIDINFANKNIDEFGTSAGGMVNAFNNDERFQAYSNESKSLLIGNELNLMYNGFDFYMRLYVGIGVVLCLTIVISLLFITQGLANISTNEVRYR